MNNKLNEQTTTIQQTNKIYKLMIIISWIIIAVGIYQLPEKPLTVMFGAILYIITKFLIWWYHK